MGTGSITKRIGKTKTSWLATIDTGVDPVTGKRQRTKRTFATKREAQDWLSHTRHEMRTGVYVEPSDERLAAYLHRWLDASDFYPATAYNYESVIRCRIIPHIGDKPLSRLDAVTIQRLYTTLRETYKPKTVSLTHLILHRALDQAVKWRLIRFNPCDGVEAPRVEETEKPAWSPEEATAFLAATVDDPLGPFWLLAVDSGMRIGEVIALRWSDLDEQRGIVVVRRTLTRNRGGGWVIGERPKSAAGRRPIVLMAMTLEALVRHKERQTAGRELVGHEWHDEGLIFDRGNGLPCSPAVVQNAFKRAIVEAGIPRVTPHQMRHTCGSLLSNAGLHPKIVQERLGHKTIRQTMQYIHTTPSAQAGAADVLAGLLGGARHQIGTKSETESEEMAS